MKFCNAVIVVAAVAGADSVMVRLLEVTPVTVVPTGIITFPGSEMSTPAFSAEGNPDA